MSKENYTQVVMDHCLYAHGAEIFLCSHRNRVVLRENLTPLQLKSAQLAREQITTCYDRSNQQRGQARITESKVV